MKIFRVNLSMGDAFNMVFWLKIQGLFPEVTTLVPDSAKCQLSRKTHQTLPAPNLMELSFPLLVVRSQVTPFGDIKLVCF